MNLANKAKILGAVFLVLVIAGLIGLYSKSETTKELLSKTFGSKKLVQELPLSGSKVENEPKFQASLLEAEEEISSEHGKSQPVKICSFADSGPSVSKTFVFNEIAWMGTAESFNNEWIELKNVSGSNLDISGYQILDKEGQIRILLPIDTKMKVGELYLLERTEDSVLGKSADLLYSGSLKNSDEGLRLFDADCNLVDEVLANPNWPAGENDSKRTMERGEDLSWHTSLNAGGTPKEKNSETPQSSSSPSGTVSQISPPPPSPSSESSPQPSPAPTPPPPQSPPPPPPPPSEPPVTLQNILISEVMVGIDGNADYEFIEFYNPNSENFDLTGWSLKKRSSTGSESSLVIAGRLDGKIIPPQKHFLLANTSSSISFADILWPKSYTLAYSNNSIILYDSTGNLIEEVGWTEIVKGQSWERISWSIDQFQLQVSPNPQNSEN